MQTRSKKLSRVGSRAVLLLLIWEGLTGRYISAEELDSASAPLSENATETPGAGERPAPEEKTSKGHQRSWELVGETVTVIGKLNPELREESRSAPTTNRAGRRGAGSERPACM